MSSSVYLTDLLGSLPRPPYRDKDFLHQKYVVEKLSVAQIAGEISSSKSAVLRNLKAFRFSIRQKSQHHGRPAQPRYGEKIRQGRVRNNKIEQEVMKWVRAMRDGGLSLRQIAICLTSREVPTKNKSKVWHPETVRRVLEHYG